MKKLVLSFGLLIAVSALMSPSFAHLFFQNHDHDNLAVRPHTERVAPSSYYKSLQRDYYRCQMFDCTGAQNRVTVPLHPNQGRNARPTQAEDITRSANTYQERYLVVRRGNYVDRLGYDITERNSQQIFTIADSADYDIAHPGNFEQTVNGDYRADGTSLAYRVFGLDQGTCTEENFWACAQGQNRAFRAADVFQAVGNVEANYRWNQTNHSNFEYFPTATESFDAVANGQAYTYYIYTALNPIDDTMVRIEAVSSTAEKRTASQQAFRLFETFRFQ